MTGIKNWDDLQYWSSEDWGIVQDRLIALEKAGIKYNPDREKLFAALDAVPFEKVRVVIMGQDPYPSPILATGFAFEVPKTNFNFPPTLHNLYLEYARDTGYDYPYHGNLQKWVRQGVLLWNAIPSCTWGKPKSHDWKEWRSLTREIVSALSTTDCCFVFMGAVARSFAIYTSEKNFVLETSHPSPLGQIARRNPFKGSRPFTTVNAHLATPVDWKLT